MNNMVPEKIIRSKKYAGVCSDTVQRVWIECSAKYKKPADIEHAVREALHGITGAFMTPKDRRACLKNLLNWRETSNDADLEAALSYHASTRERMPLSSADAVFARLFEGLPANFSVLDLACGIDPIYLAARGIRAYGMDISGDAVDLINEVGGQGMPCSAVCADLICDPELPDTQFDVVLLFKVLPLLERQRKDSARALLHRIRSPRIVVSFPTRSLGGRSVGMEAHYSQWMESNIPEERVCVSSFTSDNELFYILDRPKEDR